MVIVTHSHHNKLGEKFMLCAINQMRVLRDHFKCNTSLTKIYNLLYLKITKWKG
jgi:hypothetical protein